MSESTATQHPCVASPASPPTPEDQQVVPLSLGSEQSDAECGVEGAGWGCAERCRRAEERARAGAVTHTPWAPKEAFAMLAENASPSSFSPQFMPLPDADAETESGAALRARQLSSPSTTASLPLPFPLPISAAVVEPPASSPSPYGGRDGDRLSLGNADAAGDDTGDGGTGAPTEPTDESSEATEIFSSIPANLGRANPTPVPNPNPRGPTPFPVPLPFELPFPTPPASSPASARAKTSVISFSDAASPGGDTIDGATVERWGDLRHGVHGVGGGRLHDDGADRKGDGECSPTEGKGLLDGEFCRGGIGACGSGAGGAMGGGAGSGRLGVRVPLWKRDECTVMDSVDGVLVFPSSEEDGSPFSIS